MEAGVEEHQLTLDYIHPCFAFAKIENHRELFYFVSAVLFETHKYSHCSKIKFQNKRNAFWIFWFLSFQLPAWQNCLFSRDKFLLNITDKWWCLCIHGLFFIHSRSEVGIYKRKQEKKKTRKKESMIGIAFLVQFFLLGCFLGRVLFFLFSCFLL